MSYLFAALSVALFAWGLRLTRTVETAGGTVALARSAMATLADSTRSDAEKERVARACSLRLLSETARIIAGVTMAAAVPLGILVLTVATRLATPASLFAVLESWQFIAVSTLAITALLVFRRK